MAASDSFERDAAVPNLALGYWHALPENPADVTPAEVLAPRTANTTWLGIKGSSAGGYSTVGDLARFDRALQDHRLVGPAMTELIQAGKVETPLGPQARYAYGFIDVHVNGTRITGHGGSAPGVNARLDMYVERHYTVAVLANYDRAAEPVATKIRQLLAGA